MKSLIVNKNIQISIIIPCYNHGQYIDDAIKSVEEYRKDDYEIIIVNDGSTDEFTNIRLEELKNEGYTVIFQENQGLGKTRNNGIRFSKGKYILPLDADNKIKPDYIIKALDIMELNPSISIVYSDRQCFGNSFDLVKVGDYDLLSIIENNYIDACTVYRRTVWENIGGYDEKMPIQGLEDWDFWLSAIEREFVFFYIPEPLFFYRVVRNSMIQQLKLNPNIDSIFDYIYKKHSLLMIKELYKHTTKLQKEIVAIRNSKSYQLGRLILNPIKSFRSLLFEIKRNMKGI